MRDDRKVSVLTPVHDVPLIKLKRAYASVCAQTIGMENIEWIVVLHNCSPSCLEETRRFLEGIPDIVLKEETRPGSGVSFARNKTLEEAGGSYIFFLDADDEMKPDLIRTVVQGMEEAQADTAVFEARWQTGKRTMDLWVDSAEDGSRVFDRRDPGFAKSFAISGSMLWARCYKRAYLMEKGIRFDETLSFGEDFIFNLEASCRAERLRAFPGLCGYHYYEEGGTASPLHTGKGDAAYEKMSLELPHRYAYLVKRMEEEAGREGMDIDNLLWFRIFSLCNHLLLFGKESRSAFMREIAPVVRRLRPPVMMDPKRQTTADGICRHLMELMSLYSTFVQSAR